MENEQVPFLIVGDSAYPLLPWLTKPYTGVVNEAQQEFNRRLSSMRVVVECAFGRLQSRFRCLMKRVDLEYTFVPYLVGACCTLHNIVEDRNDPMPAAPLNCIDNPLDQPEREEYNYDENLDAQNIRNALFRDFVTNL